MFVAPRPFAPAWIKAACWWWISQHPGHARSLGYTHVLQLLITPIAKAIRGLHCVDSNAPGVFPRTQRVTMKRERVLVPSSSSFPSTSSFQLSSASSSTLGLLRSTRKHIGLVLSTLAILGLITMVDLLVLPTLTKEASKVAQASLDAFHVC